MISKDSSNDKIFRWFLAWCFKSYPPSDVYTNTHSFDPLSSHVRLLPRGHDHITWRAMSMVSHHSAQTPTPRRFHRAESLLLWEWLRHAQGRILIDRYT